MKFNRGQLVRGVVAGRFIVEESKIREIDNCEIVTVREIHPETFRVSSVAMKLPADCLVKDAENQVAWSRGRLPHFSKQTKTENGTMKATRYLVYRHGSNAANQVLCKTMPVAIVTATSKEEACQITKDNVTFYANQTAEAVPQSKASESDWKFVCEMAAQSIEMKFVE